MTSVIANLWYVQIRLITAVDDYFVRSCFFVSILCVLSGSKAVRHFLLLARLSGTLYWTV